MLSFKYYLTEALRIIDPDELEKELDKHLSAGEILNPKFKELKEEINSSFEKASAGVQNVYLSIHRGLPDEERNQFRDKYSEDFYYGITSLNSIGKMSKALMKIKASEKNELLDAARELVKTWMPIAEKLKRLKPLVVLVTKKREEAKQIKQTERTKLFSDSSSLLKALEPAHRAFIDKYAEMASDDYDRAHEQLKKGIDVIAPAPSGSKDSREDYKSKERLRSYYLMMSKTPKTHYVEEQKKQANADFQSWVEKLTDKIGSPVVEASMTGNPWTGSTLTIRTNANEVQKWNTQMIINRSKYNTAFNQFPTRRIK